MPLFGGRQYYVPTSKAVVDASAAARAPIGLGNVVGIIAAADGGEPGVVKNFSSFADLAGTYLGGDMVRAAQLIFGPSTRQRGADLVRCIRIGQTAKAVGYFVDSVPANTVKLESVDWGTYLNTVRWTVETGTNNATWPGKLLTFEYPDDNLVVAQDDIGTAFQVKYTGTCTTATMTITATALTTTITGGDYEGADDLTLTFSDSQYNTIAKVIAAISAHPRYTCEVNPYAHAGMTAVRTDGAQLDTLTAQDIEGVFKQVTAGPYLAIDWINNHVPWVEASFVKQAAIVNTTGYETWSTPGTNGAPNTTDRDDALTLFESQAVHLIWLGSDDAGWHAALKAHCHTMANRMGFVGGPLADEISDVVADAASLNSDRMVQCYPGIVRYDSEGNLETLAPEFLAAMICGLTAGEEVFEPITHNFCDVLGIEVELSMADRQTLQLGGVTCVCRQTSQVTGVHEGFWVSKGVSTIQANTQIWNGDGTTPEISLRRLADLMVVNLEDGANREFVGKSSRYLAAKLKAWVVSALGEIEAAGWICKSIDNNTGEELAAWRNLDIRQDGDVWRVDVEVNFTTPANFVFFTIHVRPGSQVTL